MGQKGWTVLKQQYPKQQFVKCALKKVLFTLKHSHDIAVYRIRDYK